MLYGDPTPRTLSFIRESSRRGISRAVGFGKELFDRVVDRHRSRYDKDAAYIARTALRRISERVWGDNRIRPLFEFWQVQNAPTKMIRWLMAEPTTRRLYHQQRADGYSDRYIDVDKGIVGQDHDDYLYTYNGHYRDESDPDDVQSDDLPEWICGSTGMEEYEDEVNLSFEDQCDIHDAHRTMRDAIRAGIDPTSKWDQTL